MFHIPAFYRTRNGVRHRSRLHTMQFLSSGSRSCGIVVTFRWKDYAHGNKQRKMTVSADEFLRRFLLHTLPRGLVRIRSFGFLAGPRRAKMLQLARQLLQVEPEPSVPATDPARASFPCPVCATPMIFGERLSAAQIRRAGVPNDSS